MKRHKGRIRNVPKLGEKRIGEYAIISKEPARITGEQMESVIKTLKREIEGEVKIIPRIKAHIAVTKKPLEVRMGKGKGGIAKRVARIRENSVIVELIKTKEGELHEEALKAAAKKLPVRVRIQKK